MTDEQRKTIAEMHANGYREKEIGKKLKISERSVRDRLDYIFFKGKGICTACNKEKATKGRLCFDCWTKSQYITAKRSEKMREYQKEHRLRAAELSRKRYAERKENGVCTRCGKRQAIKGKTYCEQCRVKLNNYQRMRKNLKRKVPKELYGTDGYCSHCGSTDLVEGTKLCRRCYEACCKNLEKARNCIDFENHPWVKDNALLSGKKA